MAQLGRDAATTGKPIPIPRKLRAACDWLVSQDLASVTAGGKLVLRSSCLQTKANLRSPTLVAVPSDCQSLFGLRKNLRSLGWSAGVASTACVGSKVFNANNCCKQYYVILQRCSLL